ncbi:MAG: DUF4350 domain-containing protein [Bacillota bacterium]
MLKGITKSRGWIWLTVLLCLFLLCSYFILSKGSKDYLPYDSHSPSPTGVKAFYTYAEKEIGDVIRWDKSPSKLGGSQSQLLLMVEPYTVPSQEVMDQYMAFMEKGNTILLLMKNPDSMFGLNTNYMDFPPSNGQIFGEDSTEYRAQNFSPVRIDVEGTDEVLLNDEQGTIALKRHFGQGSLIVSNTPDWITNDAILKEDHLVLLLDLLQNDNQQLNVLLVDEYIHGEHSGSTITTTYPQWFLLVIIQGVLWTILLLWNRGKRFGPILVAREETVRFSDENLQALAAWHIKGNRYQDSLSIQADYLKFVLQEKWGIPSSKEWMARAEQLERKSKTSDPKSVKTFLHDLTNILRKKKITKQEYLFWSKKLDQLRKEVEEG